MNRACSVVDVKGFEIVIIGIDAGGLDDLLGVAVISREKVTQGDFTDLQTAIVSQSLGQ